MKTRIEIKPLRLKKLKCLTFFALLMLNAPAVFPIIIRHDRADADYQKLGERYRDAYVGLRGATGTLIAPQWVLTAAHAVEVLVPGHADYNSSAPPAKANIGGRDYQIDKVVLHPDWAPRPVYNDIVLLRLSEPVSGIAPTRVYRKKDEVGKVVTFIGRGYPGNGKEGVKAKDMILRGAHNRVEKMESE